MSKLTSPVALVTGGAGFVGSHTVDLLLSEGFEVRVIDNLVSGHRNNLAHLQNEPRLKTEFMDIRDFTPQDAFFKNVKYVFHFAGIGDIVPSIEKPLEYMSANVQGTIHALECSRWHGVEKFVYAASSSCYGLAQELPTTENALVVPEYPYALSKYQGEQATLHWGRLYGLPVNSIRMFNVYGPRSRTTGAYGAVFGVFLKQKLAKKPFTVVGDGTQKRDFIFVSDVARAFYLAAKTDHCNEIYNMAAGFPQTINRLVELLGGGEVIHVPSRPGEPLCTWADTAKIKTQLGWTPKVSFEEGVKEVVRCIDWWKDAPLWDKDSVAEATRTWFNVFNAKPQTLV